MEEKRPFLEWLTPQSKNDPQRIDDDWQRWLYVTKKKWEWLENLGGPSPEDLVNEAFKKLLESSQASRDIDHNHFKNLVFKKIRGLALNAWESRKSATEKHPSISLASLGEEGPNLTDYPDLMKTDSLTVLLTEEEQNFPDWLFDRFKTMLEEKFFDPTNILILDRWREGITQTEIAKRLKLNDTAVCRRLEELRNLMTKFAKEEGLINEQS